MSGPTPVPECAQPLPGPRSARGELLRWFRAEERLYPVAMVMPERYETALRLVGRVTDQLRASCPDLPSLVAADAEALEMAQRVASYDPETAADIDLSLVAGAACSIRYRELAAADRPEEATPTPCPPIARRPHHRTAEQRPAGRGGPMQGSQGRHGGAGPSDSGMLWIEGVAVTVPTDAEFARTSPYVLRPEDDGFGIYRDGTRLASATGTPRPRYYDLATADGIPYWKIALLHLDSLASTVLQTCAYWGNDDQCRFCGIGLSLDAHRTIAKKRPEQLAEVAVAAKELDGAVDATLTTGSTPGADKGALYVAACGAAVKEAAGLPVEVQFEPPDPGHLDVIDRVHDLGIDSVGIHVESFDPAVLAYIAPAKARTGIEGYFAAWERAVACSARARCRPT